MTEFAEYQNAMDEALTQQQDELERETGVRLPTSDFTLSAYEDAFTRPIMEKIREHQAAIGQACNERMRMLYRDMLAKADGCDSDRRPAH